MYDLIWDFVHNELVNATTPDAYIGSLEVILTHIGIVLVFLVAIKTIVFVFGLFAGLNRW